jgi:hemolysin activation/secretion protein
MAAFRPLTLAAAFALTALPAAAGQGQPAKPASAAAAALPQPADVPPLLIATRPNPPSPNNPLLKDAAKEPCFDVDIVEVRGVALIDRAELSAALMPLAHRCLGNSIANAILAAISEQHAARGYVTTQGFIPTGQDLKTSRRLVINVITGRVGAIRYHETEADLGLAEAYGRLTQALTPWAFLLATSSLVDALDNPLDRFQLIDGGRFPAVKRSMAMPVAFGDPLQMDLVQQGLDQMNKVSSTHAAAKLRPGTDPGTSDIEIDNPAQDSFRLFAGYEINGGSINGLPGTSPQRLRIDAAKDNLIGINDGWTASIASGVDTNEVRASLAIPWRWWTLSVHQGYSESLQAIGDTAYLFSRTYDSALGLSYLAWRTSDLQMSADSSLTFGATNAGSTRFG